jgi:hypothetical protein
MTGSLQHHVHAAGLCFQQAQQRCAAMRPVVASRGDMAMQQVFEGTAGTGRPVAYSVWIKKTGAGNQN